MAIFGDASGAADVLSLPVSPTTDDGNGSDVSGWLSGLGDLFQGIGSGISSGFAAANTPRTNVPSGWAFNPATGTYYNPATGQALTATGSLTSIPGFTGNLFGSNSFLYLLVIGIAAYLLFRRRAE